MIFRPPIRAREDAPEGAFQNVNVVDEDGWGLFEWPEEKVPFGNIVVIDLKYKKLEDDDLTEEERCMKLTQKDVALDDRLYLPATLTSTSSPIFMVTLAT
ncbi:hypothetical protein M5689_015054 [Euphorbia peplus]|nr:hypothetical protein M5689_015054 [Euphorbia peplus]